MMSGGGHGVKWLGQVLLDNIPLLSGPMKAFEDWGVTLADMHKQETQERASMWLSCHHEGRHKFISGGPRINMPSHSVLLTPPGRQANTK